MRVDPSDMRLAINQADAIIDQAWVRAVFDVELATAAVGIAQGLLDTQRKQLRAAEQEMRTHYLRLGADNAVPGRSVPAMIDAAKRRMGHQR